MNSCLVSIGMPVYNGGEDLRHALDSLLAQTHSNFELIISDNASTDEATLQISEEYAAKDSRIRLTRQPVNQGATENFLWVLEQARGEYFMWAAHDDTWSANYVEVLASRLDDSMDAVLATAATKVQSTSRSGATKQEIIPEAPNGKRSVALDLFIEFNACVWIYGLYRKEWVAKAAPELRQYPLLSGDVIWIFGLLLNERITGDSGTTFFYTADHRKRKRLTYRQTMQIWWTVAHEITRLAWLRSPSNERLNGVCKAWWFVYRHHVRRKNPIRTVIRFLELGVRWSWFGLERAVHRLATLLASVIRLVCPRSDQRNRQGISSTDRDWMKEDRYAA